VKENLRVEATLVPSFDLDTTHLAIELAEDVVKIGAIGVCRNSSVRAVKVLLCPDGGAASVAGSLARALDFRDWRNVYSGQSGSGAAQESEDGDGETHGE
jgi:hypothetical protein